MPPNAHLRVLLGAVGLTLVAAWAFASSASRPTASVRDTITLLAAQGGVALEAEDKQAALDAFLDAQQLLRISREIGATDPLRVHTLHGLAVAYMRAGRLDKAGELFKAGELLDRSLATPATASRAMVVNRCVLDLNQKFNVMRAVKTARDYLAARPEEVDETVINLLGTALAMAAEDRYANSPLYLDAVKLYMQQDAKLEATRPGERRWGVEWIPEKDHKVRSAERQKAIDAHTRAMDELAEARQELKEREQRLAQEAGKRRLGRAHDYSGALADRNEANAREAAADRAATEARQRIPKFPWQTAFHPILPGDGGQPITIARAEPKPVRPDGVVRPRPVEPPPEPANNQQPPAVPVDVSKTVEPPRPAEPPKVVEPPKPARVTRYAAAFPVGPDLLISTAAAIDRAERITLEDSQGNVFPATMVRVDEASGLALIRVAGQRFAYLNLAAAYAGGTELKCRGFPQVTIFSPTPETITGRAAALKPNDSGAWFVSLTINPRLGGAPLTTAKGEVIGVVMAQRDSQAAQVPAVRLETLRAFLGADVPVPCVNPDPNFVMMLTATVGK